MAEQIMPQTLRERKAAHIPITGLTAYDYPTAVLIDRAGLDLILVGDSLGRIILGHPRIEATTMQEMIHHCAAVSRGAQRALVVGDMPFGSYEVDPTRAVENAVQLIKEGGVGAVKLEGGSEVLPAISALATARIPVFGHLAPQHTPSWAGTAEERRDSLVEAALDLGRAGAVAIVLVGLEEQTAAAITAALQSIPSIGYLSGPHCDGRLLITPAMLGLLPPQDPLPGPYGALGQQLFEAFTRFREDTLSGAATSLEAHGPDAAHR
ncbi:MAG TPA: 3-methyl-2-oxobutanoate hydroxymethyltransferase [Ktedonobacterales bacterium]|jgi:3-methyl-2-oxobutanoate hydroxymethyltransferase|nr:3-methyl-2-oxobutanoate hydroxymethyltransferase [Ktedonobacterales bacterium]